MADKKVSELTAITNLTTDDLIMVVNDPAGTASSRKVTVGNLFGNVAVITKHTSNTTFTANTTFNGTTMTVSANLVLGGSNVTDSINDRMQVANVETYLANTNLGIRDRLQVANATSTFATKAYAASNTYVNNKLTLAASITQANSVIANISANTPIIRVTSSNGIQGTVRTAPSSNNTYTEQLTVGTIFFSNNYLYIATDATTIKRVALSTF